MENEYTIAEDYTLPSKGMVYNGMVNPNIKIRSMTTDEEMKRLNRTEQPFKMLSEIIDDCLVEKPNISAYDMCLGDYEFLLYKLRIVTYGSDYKVNSVICPVCGAKHKDSVDLEALNVFEYSDELDKYLNITLPRSKKSVKLKMQTPRMLDEIDKRAKQVIERSTELKGDPAFLFRLQSLIDTVDGEVLNEIKLEQFVRSLPLIDVNYINKSLDKLKIGLDLLVSKHCDKCGADFKYPLPFTGEFFGPSIDE